MSDDFLSEISQAVAETTNLAPQQPVTTDVTADNKVETAIPDNTAVEDRLLSIMESPAEVKERETLKLKKKEPPADKAQDTKQDQTAKPVEDKNDPIEEERAKVPYLDRFLRQDEEGNLVINNGTIIAAKGPARTYYENLKKEGRDARQKAETLARSNFELGKQFKALHTEFIALQENPATKTLETQTGMTSAEINDAVLLMKQYKTDPLSAVKSFLTQARLRGIDLSSIGIDGGIDPATVQRTIENAIEARLLKQQEAKATTAPSAETATQEASEFLDAYPDAIPHVDIIAKAKDRFPEKSLVEIWHEFTIWQRNQLARQDEERQTSFTKRQQRQQPQPKSNTRVVTPAKSYAHMSYAEIARDIEQNGV